MSPIPEASYNYVARWDYSMLAEAMCNKQGKYRVFKVGARVGGCKALQTHLGLVCLFGLLLQLHTPQKLARGSYQVLLQCCLSHASTITHS